MPDQIIKVDKAIWESAIRIGISLFSGSIFYIGWLAAFLLLVAEGGIIESLLWITAPLITGLGFGVGIHLVNKHLKHDLVPFHRVSRWPILGCILGALAVYWFGPMLIVFSMLAAGTVSVFIREIILHRHTQL